jgi:hypothetical protein
VAAKDPASEQAISATPASEVVEEPPVASIDRVAERRSTWRRLGLVFLAAGATGAVVAALIVDNPAVEASIETEVPAGPIELAGHVTSNPILAKVGALELTWNPFGAQQGPPVKAQLILLEMHLSPSECARLAQIGGACGSDHAPPLRHLESLGVEATQRSLHTSVNASSASRSELEQHGETAHRGAPFEWSLRSYTPSLAISLSCGQPLAVSFSAGSTRPGKPLRIRSVTCSPAGVLYRLRVMDEGPTETTVGFDRVRQFQSAAFADWGKVTVQHGTSSVDGDSSELDKLTPVALQAEPGSTVSSRVVSPVENAPAEVVLRAPRAAHALVAGDEKTPDELERLPPLLTGLLVSWSLTLLGALVKVLLELRPRRRNDATTE